MTDGMMRKVVVFSVWCMTISVGIQFLRSDVWNTMKHMTPEEIFAHPKYFVCFVLGGLFLIGLIEATTNLWTKRD